MPEWAKLASLKIIRVQVPCSSENTSMQQLEVRGPQAEKCIKQTSQFHSRTKSQHLSV